MSPMSFEVKLCLCTHCVVCSMLYTLRHRNLTMPNGVQEALLIPCMGTAADFVGPYAG
jgi:hypothetical protein